MTNRVLVASEVVPGTVLVGAGKTEWSEAWMVLSVNIESTVDTDRDDVVTCWLLHLGSAELESWVVYEDMRVFVLQ